PTCRAGAIFPWLNSCKGDIQRRSKWTMMRMLQPSPKPVGARLADSETFSTLLSELESEPALCSTAKFITDAPDPQAKAGTSALIIRVRSAAAGNRGALRFSRRERPSRNARDRRWLLAQTQ